MEQAIQDDECPFDGPGGDGRLSFTLEVEPVSLQAKKSAREAFDSSLQSALAAFDFLIDSQVGISVRHWAIPRRRWETDMDPDLDNWLKPLIDAFVGSDRLIVDDSLIRSVDLSWGEGQVTTTTIHIRLDFDPDHRLKKQGLRYIQFAGGLCFPLEAAFGDAAVKSLLRYGRDTLGAVAELNALDGGGWRLLTNGWIHRSRLGRGFVVVPAEALEADLAE
ncbi:hypothetical protein [Micromonospora globosa]|uniref:hypothetical protein n=1 Tax=Micromonospora globosa TaxID=47863 RepID=UPI0004C0AE1A|nr:hypothetical protein [Micromonospora globosa]